MQILRTIGNVIGMIFGFILLGLVAALVAAMLLGSFWLDGAGIEQDAVVAQKYEQISFQRGGWSRTLEIGIQRDDGPMADVRRVMIRNHESHPELVGVEKVRVPIAVYDRYRIGQKVRIRVQPKGFFKDSVVFSQVRLVGVSTASIAYSLYESLWPMPEFLLTMLPAALLAWIASRTEKRLFWASGVFALLAIAYWLSPLPDRRPTGVLAEAEGKVVGMRLVDQVLETEESDGVDAIVPHQMVAVEFVPEGGTGPVVAVDRVDAPSVDLKEGSRVRVEYQRDDPRRALLVHANRTWWWMNLVSVGRYGAIMVALLGAGWLLTLFFQGLMAGRKR